MAYSDWSKISPKQIVEMVKKQSTWEKTFAKQKFSIEKRFNTTEVEAMILRYRLYRLI